ncbi:integrase [Vibrio sp. SCSIO 43137]|uniref:integrase n=1 Tax=Vibrio sp. SCSIO 43137 TaxID=3021011 RepID=UPI002306FBE7|nr:integrase [Vibrio sp. SCSIO 43137]WCE29682.1 integrase [Vibrio sp. SCSIO 43137]
MTPLFELPKNILQENISEYKKTVQLYISNKHQELDKVVVTKGFDGTPKSHFGDEEWDFRAYLDARTTYKKHIVFSKINDDQLARELKLICFSWLYIAGHHRKGAVIKPSTLMARYSKICIIYKYLDQSGYQSISCLRSHLVFNELCKHLRGLKYRAAQVEGIYTALMHVEKVSKYLPLDFELPNGLGQSAFSFDITGKSRLDGKNQFYAIPTRLMEKIYQYCFNTIDTFHPHKEAIHDLLHDIRQNYEEGKKRVNDKINSGIWSWLHQDSSSYRVEVNKHKPFSYPSIIDAHITGTPLDSLIPSHANKLQGTIIELQTICYIVCGALTGMRRSELFSLHSNSFKEKEVYGRKYYVLQSEQHKFSQGKPQAAEWVTTKYTQKAIELAEAISRHMRVQLLEDSDPMSIHNSSCLWLGQGKKARKPIIRQDDNMRRHFSRICKNAGAFITEEDMVEFEVINPNREPDHADNRLKVGKVWPLTTHQLRRTFAVFAKRHSLCHDIAIKQQFKHLDLPTTEWYGEGGIASKIKALQIDTELQSFLNEVVVESTTHKIHSWYDDKESLNLMGKMAGSINKNRLSLHKKYRSWDAINEHVKAGRLTLVGTLHSYCMAGYECQMHKVSSPANCMNCENQIIGKEQVENWQKRYSWVCKQVQDMDALGTLTNSMYSHFITQIRAAEKVLHRFQIPFTRFDIGGNKYEQIPNYES